MKNVVFRTCDLYKTLSRLITRKFIFKRHSRYLQMLPSSMHSSFGRSLTKIRVLYIFLLTLLVILIYHFGLLLHLFEVNYSNFSYPLDIPMEEVLVALKTGQTLPHKPINELKYNYRISNSKKCIDNNKHERVVILYAIKSALMNEDKRNAIRKSWGWENRFSDVVMRRIFILGISRDKSIQNQINEEYARNKDLVQAEFLDTYYNNTIKTIMGFKWVVEHCPKAQFIMFSDDDMYISTKNLLKFIRNPFNKRVGFRKRRDVDKMFRHSFYYNRELAKNNPPSSDAIDNSNERRLMELDPILSAFDGRLFSGFVFQSSPMRHKSSKWYVTLEEYPYSKYPPYVTAGAYVLSYPALEDLYFTSMFTKQFKFDDVFLGIVAKKCGISPLHNDNFYFWKKPYSKEEYSNVIASHGFSDPNELKKVWEEQRSLGHA